MNRVSKFFIPNYMILSYSCILMEVLKFENLVTIPPCVLFKVVPMKFPPCVLHITWLIKSAAVKETGRPLSVLKRIQSSFIQTDFHFQQVDMKFINLNHSRSSACITFIPFSILKDTHIRVFLPPFCIHTFASVEHLCIVVYFWHLVASSFWYDSRQTCVGARCVHFCW